MKKIRLLCIMGLFLFTTKLSAQPAGSIPCIDYSYCPDWFYCEKFYVCYSNMWYLFTCPPNTSFDIFTATCTFPEEAYVLGCVHGHEHPNW